MIQYIPILENDILTTSTLLQNDSLDQDQFDSNHSVSWDIFS